MALTPSHKPTREWPLLILTLAVVGAVTFPLWQGLTQGTGGAPMWSSWDSERWGRLLFGPEQVGCYVCFTWACLIMFSRYMEVKRQRRAFGMQLLPVEEGTRILHEDGRPLQRKMEQVMQEKGPFILANMIRIALGKYIVSRESKDVSDTVKTLTETEQGRLAASMATVHYLAWAIPALGFLGTVRGLAGSLSMAGSTDLKVTDFIEGATKHLNVAFDCTLIALFLSLGVMFLLHSVQREEDGLVIDCQQYCVEHLVNRLYDPETLKEDANGPSLYSSHEYSQRPAAMGGRSTRIS
jgi:biopolymer transport protein ExbB/TolQ